VTIDGRVFGDAEAAFAAGARVAYLATVYEDGTPHVVPISPVLDLDRLLFASESDTQKVRNIVGNPSVGVCFDEYHEDWSELRQVIVHGIAYLVQGGPEFDRDRNLLYEKFPQYASEAPIEEGTSVIVEVRVERVTSSGLERR
jgi:nitroimidazol reductase NimA-like FMN-containing flavoprotein (pyridoxamine 5'-phosphate oxidase superfamily)